jgi:hypothetical protein
MKKFAALMAIVVAVIFSAGLVISADAPAGKVTIKEIQKSKAPVTFDHKGHADRLGKCNACHHKSDEKGANATKCSAKDCHGAKAEGKKVDLKEAFHKTCKGCHQKEKKGPTKCDDCHKK